MGLKSKFQQNQRIAKIDKWGKRNKQNNKIL